MTAPDAGEPRSVDGGGTGRDGGATRDALRIVREQIAEATATKKCHACGCLHQTVAALSESEASEELAETLQAARARLEAKRYECLGCSPCFPAIATNAFDDALPQPARALELCPADTGSEQPGWPPLPGEYRVARYRAPVAVCTLDSESLAERLSERAPAGLAIAGVLRTENIGIERMIRNVLANPYVRFLVVCGEETRRSVGHLPGQSLESLFASGLDANGRIRGAKGRRPVLKNVSAEHVARFLLQVQLVSRIGQTEVERILETIAACAASRPAPFALEPTSFRAAQVEAIEAREPRRLIPDPRGFFVVYPDPRSRKLVVEHYGNTGTLECVIAGHTPAAIYSEIVARSLIERLDHAAYLGRELARAEQSLVTGERYVQDRAAGEIGSADTAAACGGEQGARS